MLTCRQGHVQLHHHSINETIHMAGACRSGYRMRSIYCNGCRRADHYHWYGDSRSDRRSRQR